MSHIFALVRACKLALPSWHVCSISWACELCVLKWSLQAARASKQPHLHWCTHDALLGAELVPRPAAGTAKVISSSAKDLTLTGVGHNLVLMGWYDQATDVPQVLSEPSAAVLCCGGSWELAGALQRISGMGSSSCSIGIPRVQPACAARMHTFQRYMPEAMHQIFLNWHLQCTTHGWPSAYVCHSLIEPVTVGSICSSSTVCQC